MYVPLLPLLLVNGSEGIGTGWSTSVTRHNPVDIIDLLLHRLNEEQEVNSLFPIPVPWGKGFRGTVRPAESIKTPGKKDRKIKKIDAADASPPDSANDHLDRLDLYPKTAVHFSTCGRIEVLETPIEGKRRRKGEIVLTVDELPLGRWTQDYKTMLTKMAELKQINWFTENHSERRVDFTVGMPRHVFDDLQQRGEAGLMKFFKLQTSLKMGNIHAFNSRGQIQRYYSAAEILEEFYWVRLKYYRRRKAWLEHTYAQELRRLQNKAKFVAQVTSGELPLIQGTKGRHLSKGEIVSELQRREYEPSSSFSTKITFDAVDAGGSAGDSALDNGFSEHAAATQQDFDYLLGMPLWSFTDEQVSSLTSMCNSKERQLEQVKELSAEQMWMQELRNLREILLKDREYTQNKSACIHVEP